MKPLSELKHLLPENPPGTPEGHYWTMNNTGTCEDFLDELTQAFVDYSNGKVVLDVGCGYGTAGISALRNAGNVVFLDVSKEHLNKVFERIDERLYRAVFVHSPYNKKLFGVNFFDAILFNKVLHLFTPEETQKSLRKAYLELTDGGKVFIKCVTPFSKIFSTEIFSADFYNIAEEFESLSDSSSVPLMMPSIFKEKLPDVISIFTIKSLEKLLKMTGFEIETCKYIPAHIESMRGEFGKDYVMAIARK